MLSWLRPILGPEWFTSQGTSGSRQHRWSLKHITWYFRSVINKCADIQLKRQTEAFRNSKMGKITSKITIMTVSKQVFQTPCLSLVSQTDSPAPHSHDWLSQKLMCCCSNKQTNAVKSSQWLMYSDFNSKLSERHTNSCKCYYGYCSLMAHL